MTPQEQQDLKVLEYIYDYDASHPGGSDMGGLYELVGDQQALLCAVALKSAGLIRDAQRMSGGYHVTAAGRSRVEAIRARRADRAYRRGQCREQVLRWLDNTTRIGEIVSPSASSGSCDGQAFDEDDLREALTYLSGQGLIDSVQRNANGDHQLVRLVVRGSDCIKSGQTIRDYLYSRNKTAGPTITMAGTGNTFTNAIGDQPTATTNIAHGEPERLEQLAQAVREMQPILGLPAAEAEAALNDIEATDDSTRVRRGLQTLAAMTGDVSTGAAGGLIATCLATAFGA